MTTELLFRDDAYLRTATARVTSIGERGIELDRTVFYPQGGGQVGDTGVLVRANGERIRIADTRKGEALDSVVHIPAAAPQVLEPGEKTNREQGVASQGEEVVADRDRSDAEDLFPEPGDLKLEGVAATVAMFGEPGYEPPPAMPPLLE